MSVRNIEPANIFVWNSRFFVAYLSSKRQKFGSPIIKRFWNAIPVNVSII